MRYFDDEYWRCRDHPLPEAEGAGPAYYREDTPTDRMSSELRSYCKSLVDDGIVPEDGKHPSEEEMEDWVSRRFWDVFSAQYPGVELSREERGFAALGYLPERVRDAVGKKDRECLEFVTSREAEYAEVCEKTKKEDPELYYHLIGGEYRDILMTSRKRGKDLILETDREMDSDLRMIVLKDAVVDDGAVPERFYVDLVEWYVEGEDRSAYLYISEPGRPRSWFSVVFKEARFVGSGQDNTVVGE